MAKDALVSEDLAQKFATEKETPYTRWVRDHGLDIISSFYVENLHTVALKPWPSRGGRGVFLNHDASRTSNDCYVCEIPPGKSLAPQRQLFEEMIYVPTQGASVAYTTETGASPKWRLYTGPIRVDAPVTIRSKAVRYGYKESAETRVRVTVASPRRTE